ncbi:MAG: zinc ribbon domain-containing protein [bacterium]|nr:zinc ribbon domain-containing protein [bacterium]
MIFIGGVQPKTVRLKKQPFVCPSCSQNEVYLQRVDSYLSFFFIPLIPVKRGTPFTACRNCRFIPETDGSSGADPHLPFCGSCNKSLDGAFSFCPFCGQRI